MLEIPFLEFKQVFRSQCSGGNCREGGRGMAKRRYTWNECVSHGVIVGVKHNERWIKSKKTTKKHGIWNMGKGGECSKGVSGDVIVNPCAFYSPSLFIFSPRKRAPCCSHQLELHVHLRFPFTLSPSPPFPTSRDLNTRLNFQQYFLVSVLFVFRVISSWTSNF